MDTHIGEFVYVTAGRDKGKCFIVLFTEDGFMYLCDGKGRKVSTPKKKNVKHISFTGENDNFIVNKLSSIGKLTNKEVRFSISKFLGEITTSEI